MKKIITILFFTFLFTYHLKAQNCDGNKPTLISITYNNITGYYEMVFDYKLYASKGCPSAVYGVKLETTGANIISASPTTIRGGTQTNNNTSLTWGNWADASSTPLYACDDVIASTDSVVQLTIILDNYPTTAYVYGETYESTSPLYGTEVVAKGTGKRSIYGCKSEIIIPSESCDASWNKPMFCDATSSSSKLNLESFVTGSTTTNWSGTGVSFNGTSGFYEFDATVLAGGSVFVTREAGAGSCAQTYELMVDEFDNDLNPVYGTEYGQCSNVPVQMNATVYGSSCEYTLRLHIDETSTQNHSPNAGWSLVTSIDIEYLINGVVIESWNNGSGFPTGTNSFYYDIPISVSSGDQLSINTGGLYTSNTVDCAYEVFDGAGNLVLAAGFNDESIGISSGFDGNPQDSGPYNVTSSCSAGSYTYSWTPSTGLDNTTISNPTVSGLASDQTYTVTITSSEGCSQDFSTTVIVDFDNTPIISTVLKDVCSSDATETINVTYPVSGQPGLWTATCGSCIDAAGNFTPTGLDVGEYFITYETPGACGGTDEINFIVYGTGLEVVTPVTVCLGDIADLESTITFVENFIVYDSIYSDPGIIINDNNTDQQTHTMTISDKPGSAVNGSIYKICIDITIDDAEDMEVFVECPDGLEIRLVADNGKDGDNYTNTCFTKDQAPSINSDNNGSDAPFTEIYTPEQPIANLNTCALNGDWTIKFNDDDNSGGAHVDILNAWSIILQEAYVPTDILWVQTNPISGTGSGEVINDSDQEDAFVTPSVEGTAIYQIQVSDNAGCTETADVTVITNSCCPAEAGSF